MFGRRSRQFCERLGIDAPLVQAPMAGGWTTPALVAAVSNAGALGFLAGTRLTALQLRETIAEIRERTNRPFGVNFLLAPPERLDESAIAPAMRVLDAARSELGLPPASPGFALPPSPLESQLDIVVEQRIPVVSFAMGCPPVPLVQRLEAAGAFVMISITTVDEAVQAAAAGADAVVAQGAEAGGHRATFEVSVRDDPPLVGTAALVPQVVDAVTVPVVASGGLMDGRGLAAALALGAVAAQMGTRFLLARESGAFPAYRRRLLASRESDTVVTRAFTGRPARGLRNRIVELVTEGGGPALPWPYQSVAAEDIYRHALATDTADWFPALAGQGLRMARPDDGAAEIVGMVCDEAARLLRALTE